MTCLQLAAFDAGFFKSCDLPCTQVHPLHKAKYGVMQMTVAAELTKLPAIERSECEGQICKDICVLNSNQLSESVQTIGSIYCFTMREL